MYGNTFGCTFCKCDWELEWFHVPAFRRKVNQQEGENDLNGAGVLAISE
jgi:hypothetical protein